MPALMLKRSSRVMPGLRGTPAGITTRSAPARHAGRFSSPVWPVTCVKTRCIMHVEMTGPQLQFGRTPPVNHMHTASREALNASHADACNPAGNVSIHNRQFQSCEYGPQTAAGTLSAILVDADQCLVTDLDRGVAVAEVCCHPNSVGDIIQG